MVAHTSGTQAVAHTSENTSELVHMYTVAHTSELPISWPIPDGGALVSVENNQPASTVKRKG